VAVVRLDRETGTRRLDLLRWGLVVPIFGFGSPALLVKRDLAGFWRTENALENKDHRARSQR
jgi:hypothetical protein